MNLKGFMKNTDKEAKSISLFFAILYVKKCFAVANYGSIKSSKSPFSGSILSVSAGDHWSFSWKSLIG